MNTKDDDPDTLQILDELNVKWVRKWLKATNKKTKASGLTIFLSLKENDNPSFEHVKVTA